MIGQPWQSNFNAPPMVERVDTGANVLQEGNCRPFLPTESRTIFDWMRSC
jgi:hypothetical protein